MMKRDLVYAALAGAAVAFTAAATSARGEDAGDVGCCWVECRGPDTVRVTVNETTAAECQASSPECVPTWSAEPCPTGGPGVPGAAGFGVRREDTPPAQR
jgi:hypothetical protein